MSLRVTIELPGEGGPQAVLSALENYKAQLRTSAGELRQRLREFEQRHGVSTEHFLSAMAAEDLAGGDMEYVQWAGHAKLLRGVEAELDELEQAHVHVP